MLSSNKIKLTLNNHAWNGGIWTTPNSVTTDPLVCMINRIRVGCTYTLSPLEVTLDVAPAGLTGSQNNILTLDTEYLYPKNGIKHPAHGGEYNSYLQFLDSSDAILQKQSFYHKVLPRKPRNFYVNSTVNDIGVENMFYVQFETHTDLVLNSYTHGTKYSRIYLEFPTVDSQGNALFANDLGGYTKTGELVGCAFDSWTTYYVRKTTDRLKCRLIKSEVAGDPVRVEIINHSNFDANWRFMRLWITKVWNPTRAVISIPISIKIDHVTVSNNNVDELYYETFDVFMNSQTPAPTASGVEDCRASCSSCTIFSGDVQTRGWFRFYPEANSSVSSAFGYYYALDTTDIIKPRSLENEYSNNYCNTSSGYFILCLAFPDVNYFVIWGYHSNHDVRLYVDFGQAISQTATSMVAKIWNQQRYIGTHTITISTTCWNQLYGDPTSHSFTSSGGSYDRYESKREAEMSIYWTTEHGIPEGGTVQIVFPTRVPKAYPHCRSMTNLGSTLTAIGGNYNG